jgi:hypothetical protein
MKKSQNFGSKKPQNLSPQKKSKKTTPESLGGTYYQVKKSLVNK